MTYARNTQRGKIMNVIEFRIPSVFLIDVHDLRTEYAERVRVRVGVNPNP